MKRYIAEEIHAYLAQPAIVDPALDPIASATSSFDEGRNFERRHLARKRNPKRGGAGFG
ncbi:hypothetical protein ACQPZA_26035 [Pseudonocardia xinjiangensis]|uniref:hypothetical protein n=1 Tax=Pseudonocardia xinjiangensis TaxID=75289 RepID=UPI003D944067